MFLVKSVFAKTHKSTANLIKKQSPQKGNSSISVKSTED